MPDKPTTKNVQKSVGPKTPWQRIKSSLPPAFLALGALSTPPVNANEQEHLTTQVVSEEIRPDSSGQTIRPSLMEEARQKRMAMLEDKSLLPMSKEDFDRYFSEKSELIDQRNMGNCYSIAAIDALRSSPHFEMLMRSSMKKNPDRSWEVRFPFLDKDAKPIHITRDDIMPQLNPQYLQKDKNGNTDMRVNLDPPDGPEGIKALEAALIKKKYGSVDRLKAEGGHGDEALLEMGGNNFTRSSIVSNKIKYNFAHAKWEPALDKLGAEDMKRLDSYLDNYNPNVDIGTANKFTSRNTAHAYSIRKVDRDKKTIKLADPHALDKPITLSYDEFKKQFYAISSIRIDNAKYKKNIEDYAPPTDKPTSSPTNQNTNQAGSINPSLSETHSDVVISKDGVQPAIEPQHINSSPPAQDALQQSSKVVRGSKAQNQSPPLSSNPTNFNLESQINTSFTTQQFIIETPGSQDIHDEVTQTQTQPSPSFRQARVLNRQFISRPTGGGGGRISSLARRSGNKMMGRIGMQAARVGAQLAAQAAIQASRLLLNPYVLLVIGILFLIIVIVAIVISSTTGTGGAEEKKISGTGESCGPVTYKGTMDSLSDSDARAQLRAAGLGPDNIKAGVSLEGIKQNTICGIINFKNESGLNNIVITSGTDGMHSTRGTYTHKNGFKLDLRINPQIDNYIRSNPNYRQGQTRRDGAAYYIGPRGNGFYREGNHWDIAFTGSNCHNMTEGQIADSNADQNTCEQTAAGQDIPENTVLSVQDCAEKWSADINSNPYKQNFGDSDCDFDQASLYSLLTELDPDQADKWFNVIIKKESGYRPNYYSKSSSGNEERWGLFQMGNGSANPLNKGDTGWEQQVTNAISFCKELNSKQISCACYWESWGESCNIKK